MQTPDGVQRMFYYKADVRSKKHIKGDKDFDKLIAEIKKETRNQLEKQRPKKMEVWLYVFLTGNSENVMEMVQKEL